jgi:hypothetical protein
MPAPLRVLRDVLGLGSHAFVCAGNNVGGDVNQLSTSYLGSVLRDIRLSAGFGLVRYCLHVAMWSYSMPLTRDNMSQVRNVGAGRLEVNYCFPLLQQRRFGDQVHAGVQIGLGTEFL